MNCKSLETSLVANVSLFFLCISPKPSLFRPIKSKEIPVVPQRSEETFLFLRGQSIFSTYTVNFSSDFIENGDHFSRLISKIGIVRLNQTGNFLRDVSKILGSNRFSTRFQRTIEWIHERNSPITLRKVNTTRPTPQCEVRKQLDRASALHHRRGDTIEKKSFPTHSSIRQCSKNIDVERRTRWIPLVTHWRIFTEQKTE